MVHCCHFPCFEEADNCQSLFLVLIGSIPKSARLTKLLHEWAWSADGINAYSLLLASHRDALAPEELMLSLSALASLHNMSSSTSADENKPSEPIQLIDVDHLLNRRNTIQNRHAVLRDMVWSFFRAVLYALPPDIYPPFVRFLNYALAAVSSSDQNSDRILDHYWMKRLLHSLSHADAVAEVWEDAQLLPAPVRLPVDHGDTQNRPSTLVESQAG